MTLHPGNCESCGAPILWGLTANAKKIPLDPEAISGYQELENGTLEHHSIRVVHFATCPEGPSWSGRSRKEGRGE